MLKTESFSNKKENIYIYYSNNNSRNVQNGLTYTNFTFLQQIIYM